MRTLFHQRRRRWPRWLWVFAVLLAMSLYWLFSAYGAIVSGFYAKGLCSSVFVSLRQPEAVVKDDLLIYWPQALFAAIDWQLDRDKGEVRTKLPFGLGSALAVHRAGAGCAIIAPQAMQANTATQVESATPLQLQARFRQAPPAALVEWPLGELVNNESMSADISASVRSKLASAVAAGFAERPEDAAKPARRTRAIVVVHKGRIVAERYADGFDANTRLAGWSMAKSVTAAWLSLLPVDVKASLDDLLALKAWSAPSDPRAALTFRHALNMTTGLDASENYASPFSDVNKMLFVAGDSGGYAAARPLSAPQGTVFSYSSATTNLISLAIRERLGADYALSPYQLLLDRIGMRTAVLEQDATGTYVGSSYLYATARDWARFGLLFARDGMWNAERLLPSGWVAFSGQASTATNKYGAHWWLHESSEQASGPQSPGPASASAPLEPLPTDLMQATGHAGQRVTVIRSKDLVIVRLGQTVQGGALRHGELIRAVVAALEP